MASEFRFQCGCCGQWLTGMQHWWWKAPHHYQVLPDGERETRGFLSDELCVVDDSAFYVRACLEFPVKGYAETLVLGVWVSLSEVHFFRFERLLGQASRAHEGPFFGWLSVSVPGYPDTLNLKTLVHLRDNGMRPYVELEPTDHPLAVEQREGVDRERIEALAGYFHRADY